MTWDLSNFPGRWLALKLFLRQNFENNFLSRISRRVCLDSCLTEHFLAFSHRYKNSKTPAYEESRSHEERRYVSIHSHNCRLICWSCSLLKSKSSFLRCSSRESILVRSFLLWSLSLSVLGHLKGSRFIRFSCSLLSFYSFFFVTSFMFFYFLLLK